MLKIKNWNNFQHFKERDPIWIKVYRKLLDDIVWHELSGEDAKTLVMLWLLASEKNGELPPTKEIAYRLRLSEKSIKSTVSRLSHFLYQDDIKPISDITEISDGYQADSPHALAERREEKEKEKRQTQHPAPPSGVAPEVWQDWLKIRKAKRLPWTETAWCEIQAEIVKAGLSEDAAIRECCARGWGSFRSDWHAKHNGSGETAYTRQQREKWETLTGRKSNPTDITPQFLEITQ